MFKESQKTKYSSWDLWLFYRLNMFWLSNLLTLRACDKGDSKNRGMRP